MSQEETEELTIQEALENAWDETDEEAPEAEPERGETALGEHESDAEDIPDEPRGEEITAQEENVDSEREGDDSGTEEDTGSDSKPSSHPDVTIPVSWGAQAREAWKDVPPAVQEQVAKREKEFSTKIQQYAETAKTGEEFLQKTAQFQNFFAADGVTATQAAVNLMQTAAGLRSGNVQQKAAIVREIIQNFGVDIATLDTMLAGQTVAQTGVENTSSIEQTIQQQLAPVQGFIDQYNQNMQTYQQGVSEKTAQTIDDFAANSEFFDDVRLDMADLVDISSKRGINLSIEEAYERACAMNPEVSKVIQARSAQSNAAGSQQNIARKRNAASSVSGSPGTGGGSHTPKPTNIRDALAQAWDATEDGI